MTNLRPTSRFTKSLKSVGSEIQKRASKSMVQFVEDNRHPSLHYEKLYSGLYSIRVDRNFRIILAKAEPNTFDVVDICDHHVMQKRYSNRS